MLEEIKKELLASPEKLKTVLEHFDYCNIVMRPKYIQFGRDETSSKKSIVIRLEDNDYLYVHDYPRNISKDFFSYIIEQRKVEFTEVLNAVKNALGITDYYDFFDKRGIFGGFYERIKAQKLTKTNTYDLAVLNNYEPYGNTRFLRDYISLSTQKYFDIRYDIESSGILIPIINHLGQLVGAKERFNYEVPDGEMKYFYSIPCRASETLYGYSQNYPFLVEGTIFVGEAEKFTLQCHSYGYRNAVSMMSGTLSTSQAKLITELRPKQVIFLHDQGYEMEFIEQNMRKLQKYARFSEIDIGFWDWRKGNYKPKVSPTDMGKDEFERILKTEIVKYGDEEIEDEL